jgi:hypothetical protein
LRASVGDKVCVGGTPRWIIKSIKARAWGSSMVGLFRVDGNDSGNDDGNGNENGAV